MYHLEVTPGASLVAIWSRLSHDDNGQSVARNQENVQH